MNGPSLLHSLLLVISSSRINLFEASAYGMDKLLVQQLLQRLINLSPCEDKVFSLKFPSLTSMITHMPFLYMFGFAIRV